MSALITHYKKYLAQNKVEIDPFLHFKEGYVLSICSEYCDIN